MPLTWDDMPLSDPGRDVMKKLDKIGQEVAAMEDPDKIQTYGVTYSDAKTAEQWISESDTLTVSAKRGVQFIRQMEQQDALQQMEEAFPPTPPPTFRKDGQ